jgi:transcriptional regulator with XRE-family HTH domain
MTITPAQSRAARGLVSLTQADLAARSGVSLRTIIHFEAGQRQPIPANLAALRTTLEASGVEFIPQDNGGPGVRLRDRSKATLIVPKFEVRQPKTRRGWYVAVMWPDGPEQQIHFTSEAEATKWIREDALGWAAQHSRSKRGS